MGMQLRSELESILLVVDTPATVAALAAATEHSEDDVATQLRAMSNDFSGRGSGIDLREVDGGWRLYTRRENSRVVERFITGGSHTKLTKAAMETLAVVAYRQPVTRSQISAIRGVNVDGVMRTLSLRGLVRECGTEQGAILYETTELFRQHLGIDSLDRLPNLAPLLPEVDQIEQI